MVQHLVDRALQALQVHGRDAEHHEAQVAHARVGHQLLHVRLHHRHQRAVDDADDGEAAQVRREVHRRVGEQRERETQQAVGPHLQQDAGQDDRPGRGRFDVRVGQPGVEREQRHLDGEGHREGQEEPHLQLAGDVQRQQLFVGEAVASRSRPRAATARPMMATSMSTLPAIV